MLNKVPEVTLYFWVIKVLCTTVGETASDYLSDNVGLGPHEDDVHHGRAPDRDARLPVPRAASTSPGIYWLGIVLISVVGTQITDNLSDNYGVSLVTTTIVFSIVLAAVFAVWFASERTLSIHTIYTTRREAFYWLAVLFTFALGTAAGDLTAERLNLGYAWSLVLFAGRSLPSRSLHYRFGLNAVARVLDRLHPHPAARRLDRRPALPVARRRRPRARHDRHERRSSSARSSSSSPSSAITRKDVTEIAAIACRRRPREVLIVAHKTAATPALLDGGPRAGGRAARRASTCSSRTRPSTPS